MTKLVSVLLAALLLCGLSAFRPDAREQAEPAAPGTEARLPVAVTLVSEQESLLAAAPKPLSLKAQKNTVWSGNGEARLMIYENGTAYLFTANEVFALQETGDGFRLELTLYRTPFDAEPAVVLPAGTIRVLLDGDTVKLEVADDPLGVLAFDGLDGAVLTKRTYAPYRYHSFNFCSVPKEPGTEWFCFGDMGDHRYAILKMTIGEDCSMTGTLTLPDGSARPCVLLGNEDGFALADISGDGPELLFVGERSTADTKDTLPYRYELARVDLDPVYDPLGLCVEGRFEIWREKREEEGFPYMLGRNLDSVILSLIRDGWTDTTEEIEKLAPILEGWFVRLVKDGQTLLIHYDLDPYLPYESYQPFPDAYALYGADGAVLQWAGERPLDRAVADGYKLRKNVYFHVEIGAWGMDVGEDEYAYFLDDGRIAIEWVPHEGGGGDLDFKIVRVIP